MPSEPSDTASITSDPSTLTTTASTTGNSVFSILRRARTITNQLRNVDQVYVNDLPAEIRAWKKIIYDK